jgi:predicted acyltransferase
VRGGAVATIEPIESRGGLVTTMPNPLASVEQRLPERLVSLDVFRGVVIAAMILVTDNGSSKFRYRQLGHAVWTNPTFTDMIAPAFLFMVGVAIPYSFASRGMRGISRGAIAWSIARRSVLLFLLGIALNELPVIRWQTLHYNGILQLVARCYFLGAMLYLALQRARPPMRAAVVAAVAFLFVAIYAALLKYYPVPGYGAGRFDMFGNLAAYVDRTVVGVKHMGMYYVVPGRGVSFDPNGLLLTIPAVFSTLAGILAGMMLKSSATERRRLLGMVGTGVLLTIAGYALDGWTPMIKNIWTSTYALFATGVSLLTFAAIYLVIDVQRWRRGLAPVLILGTNAILAFAVSTILTRALTNHLIKTSARVAPRQWMFDHLFGTWLPPYAASLAYAVAIVGINILLVYPFYRKRIFLKL